MYSLWKENKFVQSGRVIFLFFMVDWNKKIAYSPRDRTCRKCGKNFTVNFYSHDMSLWCHSCKIADKKKKELEEKGHGDFE